MPYVPRYKTLFKILLKKREPEMAETLWLEGTWFHDNGDHESARMAFRHACLLDPEFGGAFYNYAALTERLKGASKESIDAWEAYIRVAENDSRQKPAIIAKVRSHVAELKDQLGK